MENDIQIYKTIFKNFPVGLFIYDNNLVIKEFKEQFCLMLNSSREKLLNFGLNNLKTEEYLRS